jgi:drug/metabolite transporter (DMT)-like permease
MPLLTGIGLKILATFLFTVMSALIKLLEGRVPVGEIMFSRNLFALLPIGVMLLWRREFAVALRTSRPGGHVLRALVGCASMFGSFAALQRLTLPDATAIGYGAPIFGVVLAALLLRERVGVYRWSAVAVGFIAVMVMLSPYLSGFDLVAAGDAQVEGAAYALAAAVGSALAMVQVRRLTQTETTASIVFYFSLSATVISLATVPFGWVTPGPGDAVVLLAIGVLGGAAQICLTQSYRHAPASLLASFDYLTMLWSVAIGYVVFSEVPTRAVLIGAAIVIAAGLFVIWRERRLGIDRTEAKKVRTSFGGSLKG